MKNKSSFLCVRGLKSLYSCGILHGGGGGLNGLLSLAKKPHSARLNEYYGIHKNNKFFVQNAQNLNQNNIVFSSKVLNVFAFRYKENRRIGKNAYFDTC